MKKNKEMETTNVLEESKKEMKRMRFNILLIN